MHNKLTKKDMEEWLLSNKKDISIVGEYITSHTKTLFECELGHQWLAKPNKIKTGAGCPTCNGGSNNISHNKISLIDQLNRDGKGIILIGEYVNAHSKTLFQCANEHQWLAVPHSIKNIGSGCPKCADYTGGGFDPNKEAWEYVFIRDEYLKFGITNNIKKRLNAHQKNGSFELVYLRHRDIGQDARNWETNIKRLYGGRYVTKEQCPDGYTETLPATLLETILNLNNPK